MGHYQKIPNVCCGKRNSGPGVRGKAFHARLRRWLRVTWASCPSIHSADVGCGPPLGTPQGRIVQRAYTVEGGVGRGRREVGTPLRPVAGGGGDTGQVRSWVASKP